MASYKLFIIVLVVPILFGGKAVDKPLFTVNGYGPDKWASIWLLELRSPMRRKVELVTVAQMVGIDESFVFDVEGAILSRDGKNTTYDKLIENLNSPDYVASMVGEYIREIEIDAWSGEVSLESRVVEQGFRSMQLRYGRGEVTKACYLEFFDNVAAEIEVEGLLKLKSPDELIPAAQCLEPDGSSTQVARSILDLSVPILPLQDVLHLTANNQSPIYLDTRETWEFEEGHIPGAQNLKLREIDEESAQDFLEDSLVIAYCVKDFRGYEAARKLRSYGVNAAIMTPHGLRGWIEADLPVEGPRGLPTDQAMAELKRIALNAVEAQ